MQNSKQPSYLIWLNRIIILFILLNLTIISSLPNLAEVWTDLKGGVGFCDENSCGLVSFLTNSFVSYFAFAAIIAVILKEWLFKPLSTRLKLNTTLFLVTFIFVIAFFALFYWPINSMGTPV